MDTGLHQRFYPYARPCVDDGDIAMVSEVLHGSMLTTGPRVGEFEEEFARRLGEHIYAVAVSSGTAALHLAALGMELGPGDEVIVPTLSFLATANAVRYTGATPVFVDIDPNTRNLDLAVVDRIATARPQIKALFPVHFGGLPCAMLDIRRLAFEHDLAIVEDAAHALGSRYRIGELQHEVGDCAHSHVACFSFHAVKNIATGEGGMVVTRDAGLAERIRRLRHHGLESDASDRALEGPWYRSMSEIGFNYRITDFQCALGISQLARLETFIARRREIARRYDRALGGYSRLVVRPEPPGLESSYHLYVMELGPDLAPHRREIFEGLADSRLGVTVNYLPIHLNPYYSSLVSSKAGDHPHAERFYERSICLPMYPDLTDADVDEILRRVRRVLEGYD